MQKKRKSIDKVNMTRHTLNTIAGGFVEVGKTSSARKIYARTVMHVSQESPLEERYNLAIITFSKKDVE